jgi:hypothetical protein
MQKIIIWDATNDNIYLELNWYSFNESLGGAL